MFSTPRKKSAYKPSLRKQFDAAAVYFEELPDLKEYENGSAWACCPFHDDHNPSFSVNMETGWYMCHSSSCGVSGTSIVSFVSALHDLNFLDTIKYLEDNHG